MHTIINIFLDSARSTRFESLSSPSSIQISSATSESPFWIKSMTPWIKTTLTCCLTLSLTGSMCHADSCSWVGADHPFRLISIASSGIATCLDPWYWLISSFRNLGYRLGTALGSALLVFLVSYPQDSQAAFNFTFSVTLSSLLN